MFIFEIILLCFFKPVEGGKENSKKITCYSLSRYGLVQWAGQIRVPLCVIGDEALLSMIKVLQAQ